METKRIGNVGEVLTQAELVRRGIPIYIPFGENERVDIIADFNGKLNKIQCKTSEKFENGKIGWRLSSRTTAGCRKYTDTDVDYFALYNIQSKIHILVPYQDLQGRSSLVISIPYQESNNQMNSINYETYTFDKILGIDRIDL